MPVPCASCTTVSSQDTCCCLDWAFRAGSGKPRLRFRENTQPAKVWYLMPESSANCAPLKPLRSNSSSNVSRLWAGVNTRPRVSVFKIRDWELGVELFVFVIAKRYDVYDPAR